MTSKITAKISLSRLDKHVVIIRATNPTDHKELKMIVCSNAVSGYVVEKSDSSGPYLVFPKHAIEALKLYLEKQSVSCV